MTGSEAPLLLNLLEILGLGFFAEFGFMQRALLGCLALSIGAAPVGVFLMLRRMSLAGDAMAHAVLPGAAIGFLASGFLGTLTYRAVFQSHCHWLALRSLG